MWACRGVEGGNGVSSLFDQRLYFLIPHHPAFLGKNVPSLHQGNREIEIAFGVTYFPHLLCPALLFIVSYHPLIHFPHFC